MTVGHIGEVREIEILPLPEYSENKVKSHDTQEQINMCLRCRRKECRNCIGNERYNRRKK